MRYIKQLKARVCPITLGENNVLTANIAKHDGFLHFQHLNTCTEREHLKASSGPNSRLSDEQREEIISMRKEGKSIRQIASSMGLSVGVVHKVTQSC